MSDWTAQNGGDQGKKRRRFRGPEKGPLAATIDKDGVTALHPDIVLGDGYTQNVETETVYAGVCVDKKKMSSIIADLQAKSYFPSLAHCKRVKGGNTGPLVWICPEKDVETNIEDHLNSKELDLALERPLVTVQVPKDAPLTRTQFEASKKFWPVVFHENKHLTRALTHKLFDEVQIKQQMSFMLMAIDVARRNNAIVGATLVDPKTGAVVACHADERGTHPLKHAVMKVIEERSKQIRTLDTQGKESKKAMTYLCTGLDLFLTREPCPMCAMALVHSRIGRVFYGCPVPGYGALGSLLKIHVQESLNHHFEVWTNVCATQCALLDPSHNNVD